MDLSVTTRGSRFLWRFAHLHLHIHVLRPSPPTASTSQRVLGTTTMPREPERTCSGAGGGGLIRIIHLKTKI